MTILDNGWPPSRIYRSASQTLNSPAFTLQTASAGRPPPLALRPPTPGTRSRAGRKTLPTLPGQDGDNNLERMGNSISLMTPSPHVRAEISALCCPCIHSLARQGTQDGPGHIDKHRYSSLYLVCVCKHQLQPQLAQYR